MTGGFYTEAPQQDAGNHQSTTSSMARVPGPREDPNQDPVAAVAVVAAESTLVTPENPPNQLEKVERLYYLMIYVGGVENLDTRKVNHAKLQRQSAEAVE